MKGKKVEYKPDPGAWAKRRNGKRPPAAKKIRTGSVYRSPAGDSTNSGLGYVAVPSGKLKWASRTARSQPNAKREGNPENLPGFLKPPVVLLTKRGTPRKRQPPGFGTTKPGEHFQPGTGPSVPFNKEPARRTNPKPPAALAKAAKRQPKIKPAPGSKLDPKTRKVER